MLKSVVMFDIFDHFKIDIDSNIIKYFDVQEYGIYNSPLSD